MLVDINLLPEKETERSRLLIAALAILGAAVLVWLVVLMLSNNLEKETQSLKISLFRFKRVKKKFVLNFTIRI